INASTTGCGHHGGTNGDGGNVPDGAQCPAYQINCMNQCVSTGNPMNCGSCGMTCPSNQVCSAGGCANNCLPGLSACSQACVDTTADNDNCGNCGHQCGSGMGCVDGSCVPAATFTPPAKCVGG